MAFNYEMYASFFIKEEKERHKGVITVRGWIFVYNKRLIFVLYNVV